MDDIHPEMLKALDIVGLSWLMPLQSHVVVPIFNKGDQSVCSNYRCVTLLSLPGRVYSRVLERRLQQIIEPQIQEQQCGFRGDLRIALLLFVDVVLLTS